MADRRILIAGSRDFPAMGDVSRFVRALANHARSIADRERLVILDGGARGVDAAAHEAAAAIGLRTERLPAPWALLGKMAGHIRNAVVVERATEVVCFWDGKSRGTWCVILIARWLGKPCRVFTPTGEIAAESVGAWA